MTDPRQVDVCVIGAGSAGLTVAAGARAVGLSVVLAERGEMGGECLNTGCVPSKALIAAARHAHAVERARRFGVAAGPARVDPEAVHAHVHRVIGAIAPHDSVERFEGLGATVLRGSARFVDPETVEVGDVRVRARRFVVATGSRPAVPPVPGLEATPFLTNESVFDLRALPDHLLVIGAGAIGLELAQAFRRLGSRVTVVEAARPFPHDDPDCARVVLDRLAAEGVEIRAGTSIRAASAADGGVRLEVEANGEAAALHGSHLLVAAGRLPNTDGLGLEAAGVAFDRRGVETDAAMRTSNRRVFAIGDVARSFRFTHWAGYQGGLVVRTILTGWPHRENRDLVAWATYTDPEIAHVGLGEAAARERHGDAVAVHRWSFSGNDRAQADLETEGLIKLVAGRGGRILGADVAGAGAGEIAALAALAVSRRLTLAAFAGMIVPYPTLAEVAKRAAVASYAARLDQASTRRLLGAVRWVGRRLG